MSSRKGRILKSAKIDFEEEVQSTNKSRISSATAEVQNGERIEIIFPFFHLFILRTLLTPNPCLIESVLKVILAQCLGGVKNEGTIMNGYDKDSMNNLKLALTEKIHCPYTNLYIEGMNALHFACFCHCKSMEQIKDGLCFKESPENEAILSSIDANSSKFQDTLKNCRPAIRTSIKSAMKDETKNTKETPSNIAARYCHRKFLWDFCE